MTLEITARRFRSVAAVLLTATLILSGLRFGAVAEARQWSPYNPVIAGIPVHCTSFNGQPVAFVSDPRLPDVGRAQPGLPPTIELNPYVLAQLTPKMQLFWYGHECAHHVLGRTNSESNADCWAIKTMRNQGLLSAFEVPQLQAQIAGTRGSMWGHLPGPARAGLLGACFRTPRRTDGDGALVNTRRSQQPSRSRQRRRRVLLTRSRAALRDDGVA